MKVYTVIGKNVNEIFYSLPVAKKAMKQNPDAKGFITKIYSNGDSVNCGEISLTSDNKTFVANSRQTIKNY